MPGCRAKTAKDGAGLKAAAQWGNLCGQFLIARGASPHACLKSGAVCFKISGGLCAQLDLGAARST